MEAKDKRQADCKDFSKQRGSAGLNQLSHTEWN